jgi:hypothetical protein
MIRTVQNVEYGAGETEFKEVTIEVVYESITTSQMLTNRTKAPGYKDPKKNKNQLQIGPFSADISLVNQTIDSISNVPDWFTGALKI